jgi:nucleoside-diphosphate-sugar epimerase
MTPKRVLVLGAAGRFGDAAAQAFAAAGWQVLAQRRRPPARPLLPGARALLLPLGDADALADQAAGARVVVYAVNPPYWRWNEELLPLFNQGLAVAERLGARLMLPGNVYNYGTHMPPVLDEQTPAAPDTAKGRLRAAMEDELQRRAAQGLRSVVIRAGDFFGAGRGTYIDELIVTRIARGKLIYPGPLDRVHAWAYLPDLARAFVAVADALERDSGNDSASGLLRLHFGGHAVTGADFIAALEQAAAQLGLAPKAGFRVGGIPWPLVRVAGLFSPMLREVAGMSYLWRAPHALDGRLMRQRFKLPAPTPLAEALKRTLLDLGLGSESAIVAPPGLPPDPPNR